MSNIEHRMHEKGWYLKPEVWQELAAVTGTTDVAHLHQEALNKDIRKLGIGMFPDDISSKAQHRLQGKFIVQVGEVLDISRPSYSQQGGHDVILYCQCTDGRVQAHAVALNGSKSELSTNTVPGSKLLLDHARVEQGLILLDPGVCQALGGRVPTLADAFEAQRKYGGVTGRTTKKEIHSMGPAFSHFDPTRGRQKVPASKPVAGQQLDKPGTDAQQAAQEQRAGARPAQPSSGPAGPSSGGRPPQEQGPQLNAAAAIGNAAVVKQKLQSKLAAETPDAGNMRGRGRRGRGRRGRGRFEEEEQSNVMTMEEWEARKAGTSTSQTQIHSDEELARQLQAQLHAADAAEGANRLKKRDDIKESLFTQQPREDTGGGRKGRGRGRRRG